MPTRRVNTRVVIDILSGEVLERESYLYSGPVELCGPSDEFKKGELQLKDKQLGLAEEAQGWAREDRAFGIPLRDMAANFYKSLASGDPNTIMKAISPTVSQINTGTRAVQDRIMTEAPRGGEQRLAMQNAEIARTAQIGDTVNRAHTSAFPALAQMGQGGLGLSLQQIAAALGGYRGADQSLANLGQAEAQGKASTMGFLGSLAGMGGLIGGGAMAGRTAG